jgi:hypothetical protein
VDKEPAPPESHAPFSLVAISALLWTQGVIWALLGTAAVLALSAQGFGGGLIAAVLFGFTAWSWILGTMLPRRGSDRARRAAAGHQIFMTCLGLAILGTGLLTPADLFFIAPVGLFIVFGIFCSACAVAGLQTAPAREYCQPRTTLSLPAITWASPRSRLSRSPIRSGFCTASRPKAGYLACAQIGYVRTSPATRSSRAIRHRAGRHGRPLTDSGLPTGGLRGGLWLSQKVTICGWRNWTVRCRTPNTRTCW